MKIIIITLLLAFVACASALPNDGVSGVTGTVDGVVNGVTEAVDLKGLGGVLAAISGGLTERRETSKNGGVIEAVGGIAKDLVGVLDDLHGGLNKGSEAIRLYRLLIALASINKGHQFEPRKSLKQKGLGKPIGKLIGRLS